MWYLVMQFLFRLTPSTTQQEQFFLNENAIRVDLHGYYRGVVTKLLHLYASDIALQLVVITVAKLRACI